MKSPKLVLVVDEKSHFSVEDIALLRNDYELIPIYLNLIEKDFLKTFNIGVSKIIPGSLNLISLLRGLWITTHYL